MGNILIEYWVNCNYCG